MNSVIGVFINFDYIAHACRRLWTISLNVGLFPYINRNDLMIFAPINSSPTVDSTSMNIVRINCQNGILPIAILIIDVTGALIGKKVRIYVSG